MSVLEHFGLRVDPFGPSRDEAFFYPCDEHLEGLERMAYVAEEEGLPIGVLTGEIGSGKTYLALLLEERLRQSPCRLVRLANCGFPIPLLLAEILTRARGDEVLPPERESFVLLREIHEVLEALEAEGRRLVILFDEAQEFDEAALRRLKALTNLTSPGPALLLVGQPELLDHVRRVPEFAHRVGLVYHLPNLPREEIRPYLRHRLLAAGHRNGDLFEESCVPVLHETTGGNPRRMNQIGRLALDAAFAAERGRVDGSLVRMIAEDLLSGMRRAADPGEFLIP